MNTSEIFIPYDEDRNVEDLSSNASVSSYLNKIQGMKTETCEVRIKLLVLRNWHILFKFIYIKSDTFEKPFFKPP